jgi:predicted enzyme related to lactoylglutathione lyase
MTTGHEPVVELRVALSAADYASLVEFYCTGLGIEPAETWTHGEGHGILLDMGRAKLELFDEGYASFIDEVEVGQRVSGHVRLAIKVPDLESALVRVVQHGGTVVHPPVMTPWGDMNARVRAPDGLQVTLFQVRSDP